MSDFFQFNEFPSDLSSFTGPARDWLLSHSRRQIEFHRSQAGRWETIEKALAKPSGDGKTNENDEESLKPLPMKKLKKPPMTEKNNSNASQNSNANSSTNNNNTNTKPATATAPAPVSVSSQLHPVLPLPQPHPQLHGAIDSLTDDFPVRQRAMETNENPTAATAPATKPASASASKNTSKGNSANSNNSANMNSNPNSHKAPDKELPSLPIPEEEKPIPIKKKLPAPPLPTSGPSKAAASPPMPPIPTSGNQINNIQPLNAGQSNPPASATPVHTASATPSGATNQNSAVARRHSAFMDGLALKLGGGPRPLILPMPTHNNEDKDDDSPAEAAASLVLKRGAVANQRRRPTKKKTATQFKKTSSAAPLQFTLVDEGEEETADSAEQKSPVALASPINSAPSSPRGQFSPRFRRSDNASPPTFNQNQSQQNQPDEKSEEVEPPTNKFKKLPNPPLPIPNAAENGATDELAAKLKSRVLPNPPKNEVKPAKSKDENSEGTTPRGKSAAELSGPLPTPPSVAPVMPVKLAKAASANNRQQQPADENNSADSELKKKLQKKREAADGTATSNSSAAASTSAAPAPAPAAFAANSPAPSPSPISVVSPKHSHSRSVSFPVAVASPTADVAACATCGCSDYKPNAFKKNSCNNCFHEH